MKKVPDPIAELFMLVLFFLLIMNMVLNTDPVSSSQLTITIIFTLVLLFINQMFGRISYGARRIPTSQRYLYYHDLLRNSTLVNYKSGSGFQYALADMVDYILGEKPVILVSSPAMSNQYRKQFDSEVKSGNLTLVEIGSQKKKEYKLVIGEEGETGLATGTRDLIVRDIDDIGSVLKDAEEGTVFFLEPLTDMTIKTGFREAYTITRGWLNTCSRNGVAMVAFLNPQAHRRNETKAFENLFMKNKVIKDGLLKGKVWYG